jgi:hypothetical protein
MQNKMVKMIRIGVFCQKITAGMAPKEQMSQRKGDVVEFLMSFSLRWISKTKGTTRL